MRKHCGWLRSQRTTAEKRANQQCEYVRAKRRPHNLADAWDDKPTIKTRCWKDYRKTQYRPDGRGARHEMIFDSLSWKEEWALEEYLKDHNIPYRIEDIKESRRRKYVVRTKREKWYERPVYTYNWRWFTLPSGKKMFNRERGHQIGWEWVYRDVPLDKPIIRWYNYKTVVATRLVWWSDKNIGIKYILNRA